MENRNNPPVVVRLPDIEENLVAGALSLRVTGDSLYIATVWEGKTDIRKYDTLPEAYDDQAICIVVNRPGTEE